ncbi:acetylcholine receptor subunit alpha-like isoform X3 [Bactrocera neohumeralis]|uniref:acetylcholine receptor subunit alpha-like isoform X3 n=1 Tax=Bactrocera neohumeralis TaxID=98809 RepID=UPI002166159A|nr:acetylcholine receptor subunit alpha-like isoform X3 [Bactrocera neohumeralis]
MTGSSADGHYEITLLTKATVHSSGIVMWQPPVVYKSSCSIDVAHFPYDVQTCILKIGSWTYDGFKVDLRHMDEQQGNNIVDVGVDLSEFYMSVEWDILEVPAVR